MKLLEFGLSAAKLSHRLAIIHLLLLVALELLLVKFLRIGPSLRLFIDLPKTFLADLAVHHAQGPRVIVKTRRIDCVVDSRVRTATLITEITWLAFLI